MTQPSFTPNPRSGPKTELIAARAYQLYLERGRTDGHDVDDWLQAEYELIQLPVRKIAEMTPPGVERGKPRTKSIIDLVRTAMYYPAQFRHHEPRSISVLSAPATAALGFYSDGDRHGGR